MDKKNDSSAKSLKISEEVLKGIVKYAATSVEGVCGLYKKNGKYDKNSIEMDLGSEYPSVSVKINVRGSADAKNVCENVQKKIHGDVLSMTGIAFTAINVTVCSAIY